MRSLEVINQIFTLMHPSNGILAELQLKLESQPNLDEEQMVEIRMDTYVNNQLRKQILNTTLSVIKTYSHCSIACQLSIMILDSLKTQFDITDIV